MVGALSGALDMDALPAVLSQADELASTGQSILKVAEPVGNVLGIVGIGLDGLSLAENIACGDGWGATDDAISIGLGVAGMIIGLATPVGWAVAGAGLLWGAAQLLSGDVPVTERIAGWFS